MRSRLQLVLPYLFLLLVVGVLIAGGLRRGGWSIHAETLLDPVCGMQVGDATVIEFEGTRYGFCTHYCEERFEADPRRYLDIECLVCRIDGTAEEMVVVASSSGSSLSATWHGKTYSFCTPEHRRVFQADPAGYFMHTMWGIPGWLYYSSIALILILSFGIIEFSVNRGSGKSLRIDLMSSSLLKAVAVHPKTRFVARLAVVSIFLLIIAAGLFGHQLSAKNLAPILTWTLWWGALVWIVAYLGKAWCYACPWDAIADWAEGLRLWGRKKEGMSLGLKWPRFARNIWPATILFVGLTWVELGFGVTMNPRATALLGLAMLALGFVSAFVFDRRSFCRYGCLVGRVSGLYALFSPVEVRARDRDVCASCTTSSCFKGNARGEACPTYQYLGTMDQNTYCISCLECVKTCDHDNVALNLRPWGEDLIRNRKPRADEAYLSLLMLTLTAFHGLTMTGVWRGIVATIESGLGVGTTVAFSIGMTVVTLLPVAIYALFVALSRWIARAGEVGFGDYFIRYAYALLPIAFFYHLAHNSEHLLMEGQRAVSLMSDPFGNGWNLLGTAGWQLSPLTDLPTLWILQVLFVMVGHVYSLWAARCAAAAIFVSPRAAARSQLPMLIAMILFSVASLWLLKQPMEMRSSAM